MAALFRQSWNSNTNLEAGRLLWPARSDGYGGVIGRIRDQREVELLGKPDFTSIESNPHRDV